MVPGDSGLRLQAIQANVAPVAPVAEIAADPPNAPGAILIALVQDKLDNGLYQVVAGGNALQLALPAYTQRGQAIQVQQDQQGRWTVAGTRTPATLTARVEERMPNGLYKVAVGIRTIQVALPPQTRVGQQVQLRPVAGGNWELADPAAGAPPSTFTEVSNGGHLIDLLRQAVPAGADATRRAPPLLNATAAAGADAEHALPQLLASALARAVGDSGLFYESHLQQWSAGNRPLGSLAHEPQSELNLHAATPADRDQRESPVSVQAFASPAQPNAAAPADTPAASMLSAGVHPDALPIISQQLATLETGKIAWNGELWPGQNLQWEIEHEQDGKGESGTGGGTAADPAESVWRTRLSICFPQLGAVSASIALRGDAVNMQLSVADPVARAQLASATPLLAGALGAAGLAVRTLGVDHAAAGQT